jgi:hypothetical protein
MTNVIDFTSRRNEKLKQDAHSKNVVHEDPFIRVFESGEIEYTEAGIAEFLEPFEYAGHDIHEIKTIREHAHALDNIRFSSTPPFS